MERLVAKVARLKILGSNRSRTETSFENRVNIRPIGLESKNKIFDLSNFSTITLCIFVVLLVKIIKIVSPLEKVSIQ